MNEIRPFQFGDGATVRTVVIDGEPHFVGKDVADALGYANASKAMGDHCKGVTKRYPLQTGGGVQEARVLTEPDMMRLIVNSTLPAAERFERWVFEDVLPTIRRTGGYQVAAPIVPQSLAQALRLAADQAEQIEQQDAALAIAAPKVEFADKYASSTGTKGFRQVCKLLNANESRFREFLKHKGIAYYLAGELTPYQQHIDAGRFSVKAGTSSDTGHAYNQAKFTPKGVLWVAGEWAKWQIEQGDEQVSK